MKLHFKLYILLTYALLCKATVVPRRTRSNDVTPYLHSFGIPLTARQDVSCFSEEECGEGMLCVQLYDEPFCKTECDGFCIPEKARDLICNCDLPCTEGICTDPIPGAERSDNGVCASEKDREPFKCAGNKEDDTITGGGTETDKADNKEDTTDERDSTDEEEGDDVNDEERDDDEAVGPQGELDKKKEGEEKESGQMEEEKDSDESGSGAGSMPEQAEFEEMSPSPDTPEEMSPSPDTPEATVPSTDTPEPTVSSPEIEQPGNPEEQSSASCISTEHLTHLPSSSLVFRNDVLAPVLCDTSGSCATAGHMVVFRGRGMMMRGYCEEVGCVKRVMRVNSPMYKAGVRVESRSSDMSFTALAARFETVAEEAMLAAAVKVGL